MTNDGYRVYQKIMKLRKKEEDAFTEFRDSFNFEDSKKFWLEVYSERPEIINSEKYIKELFKCLLGKGKLYPNEHFIDMITGYIDGWCIRNSKTDEPEFNLSLVKIKSYNDPRALFRILLAGSYDGVPCKSMTGEHYEKYNLTPVLIVELRPKDILKELKKLSTEDQLYLELNYNITNYMTIIMNQ